MANDSEDYTEVSPSDQAGVNNPFHRDSFQTQGTDKQDQTNREEASSKT